VQVTGKDFRFTWATALNAKKQGSHRPTRVGRHHEREGERQGRDRHVQEELRTVGKPSSATSSPQHAPAGHGHAGRSGTTASAIRRKGNAPISDGPFLLTKFDRGSGITLEKNTHGWYGKPAKLSSVVFPLHHEHELRDPGDPWRRGRRDLSAAAAGSRRPEGSGRSADPDASGPAGGAHRDPAGCEGQSAGEADMAPPGPDHRAQPHRCGQGPVRHAELEDRRAEQPRSPSRTSRATHRTSTSGTTTSTRLPR